MDDLSEERLEEIEDLWHCLTDREQSILRDRFGLDGRERKTLSRIARELPRKDGSERVGVTREIVRMYQNIALRKLKRLLDKRGF